MAGSKSKEMIGVTGVMKVNGSGLLLNFLVKFRIFLNALH